MKQKGFTLIELLVGLAISMLCMVLVMMMFKQIMRTGAEAARDAEYDAQLETSMLIAQKLVQNAGYGSGAAADIAVGSYNSKPAMFWRLIPNLDTAPTVYQCSGLAEEISASGTRYIHKLRLLSDATPCAAGDDLATKSWTNQRTLISIKNDSADAIFSYALGGNCSPFGAAHAEGTKKIIITGTRPDIDASAIGHTIQRAVCLKNIINP